MRKSIWKDSGKSMQKTNQRIIISNENLHPENANYVNKGQGLMGFMPLFLVPWIRCNLLPNPDTKSILIKSLVSSTLFLPVSPALGLQLTLFGLGLLHDLLMNLGACTSCFWHPGFSRYPPHWSQQNTRPRVWFLPKFPDFFYLLTIPPGSCLPKSHPWISVRGELGHPFEPSGWRLPWDLAVV